MESWNCSLPRFSLSGNTYKARLIDIHDGDTITVAAEVFPGNVFQLSIRLLGIDAPEITSKDPFVKQKAEAARMRLVEILGPGLTTNKQHFTRNEMRQLLQKDVHVVIISCQGMDKYGRVLSRVWSSRDWPDVENILDANSVLIREGHAKVYELRSP